MRRTKKGIRRLFSFCMALALLLGGLSLTAYADEEKSFKERAMEAAATMPKELPNAKIKVTADVGEDTEEFTQTGVVYQTFDENADPKNCIEETVEVNGVTYKVIEAGEPKLLSSEEMIPAGVDYESEPFKENTPENEPDEEINYEGVALKLFKKELQEIKTPEKTEFKRESIIYRKVEANLDPPETQTIEFKDLSTGQMVTEEIPLKSFEVTETYWSEEFTFPIQISNYDADEFDLNGTVIKKNEPLIEYAPAFLEMLNLDPDYYEIDKIEWAGEPYQDASGVQCRNAAAYGKKLLKTIEAVYEGDVVMPSTPAYKWVCEYRVEVPEETSVVYTMVTDVKLQKVEAGTTVPLDQKPKSFWERFLDLLKKIWEYVKGKVSAAYEVTSEFIAEHPAGSAVGVVVVAGFIVFLLLLRGKKRCIYDKNIKCPYGKHDKETCEKCANYYKTHSTNNT